MIRSVQGSREPTHEPESLSRQHARGRSADGQRTVRGRRSRQKTARGPSPVQPSSASRPRPSPGSPTTVVRHPRPLLSPGDPRAGETVAPLAAVLQDHHSSAPSRPQWLALFAVREVSQAHSPPPLGARAGGHHRPDIVGLRTWLSPHSFSTLSCQVTRGAPAWQNQGRRAVSHRARDGPCHKAAR
jgi:hypothetical protein